MDITQRNPGELVLSILINWVFGLFPVAFLRLLVLRRPLGKKAAIWVTVGVAVFLLFTVTGLAHLAGIRPNMAPVAIWTFLTYTILRAGKQRSRNSTAEGDLGQDTMTTVSGKRNEPWPFPNPRVAGVQEHYQRVKFFHALAGECSDPAGKFRLLLAGVYSARAVVELIFEAACKGELKRTRKDLETHLGEHIPWYELIEKIRIHDFHRFGLVPPDSRFRVMMQGGPVKLRAQKGAAIYRVPASGPEKSTTGSSKIQEQRPLLSNDGQFFDDGTRQYVPLDRILQDFIAGAVGAIREFERNLEPTNPST